MDRRRVEWAETAIFPWRCPTIETQLAAIEAFERSQASTKPIVLPKWAWIDSRVIHSKLAFIGEPNPIMSIRAYSNRFEGPTGAWIEAERCVDGGTHDWMDTTRYGDAGTRWTCSRCGESNVSHRGETANG